MAPSTPEILAEVNAACGATYQLVRRLAGGFQSGAYEVRDAAGAPAVLKWSTDKGWAGQVVRAARAVERVRAHGWPTARWLAAGTTADGYPYQLQEFIDGRPMGRLGDAEVGLLLDLVERQCGIDPDPERNWSRYVCEVVFANRDDAHDLARRVDHAAAALVDRFLASCEPYRGCQLPAADLVHGDLNPGNVLVSCGRIVAAVDIEALGSGTRAVDLAGLLATGYATGLPAPALARLQRAALVPAGPAGLMVSAAAGFLSMVAFLARTNPGGLSQYSVAMARMLDDLTGVEAGG